MILSIILSLLVNPILPGFHPDPSIVAVGNDYYIVNSSFHYFPGVPISHSRDLVHWEQIGNVLDRPSQLPLKDATSWRGIYAPTIRYNDGVFYMITTNVGNGGNFMVTATDPAGPWSEPIWLEQQGIDPSLYFEDGKCYMVSNPGGVITLCEIDPVTGATLSPSKPLWSGTGGRYPEGPHIYKKGGWYYLLISEGGTELAHKLTVARSRKIYGPYKASPTNPIFTHCSQAAQGNQIQGTGHGDLFQKPDGSWGIVFLAYRRYGGDFHHLGRETFIAPVTWEKGWPVINGGKPVEANPGPANSKMYRFYLPKNAPVTALGHEWMHLQQPVTENYAFKDGRLVLHGSGIGLSSQNASPTAILRRQERACALMETLVELEGDGKAGLCLYQIFCGHAGIYLCSTDGKHEVQVKYQIRGTEHVAAAIPLQDTKAGFRISAYEDRYDFELLAGGEWQKLSSLDVALLSTEVAGGFTGVTTGMHCENGEAAFDYFTYSEF